MPGKPSDADKAQIKDRNRNEKQRAKSEQQVRNSADLKRKIRDQKSR